MKDTRVFRSADIGSDHFLVCESLVENKNKPKGDGYNESKIRHNEFERRRNEKGFHHRLEEQV